MKYVIASHLNLALAYKEIVDYFLPGQQVYCFCFHDNESFSVEVDNFIKKIDKNEDILVFTDLLSGYTTNVFCKYINEYNIHLISSVNLELILDCIMKVDKNVELSIQPLIENSKNSICYVNKLLGEKND